MCIVGVSYTHIRVSSNTCTAYLKHKQQRPPINQQLTRPFIIERKYPFTAVYFHRGSSGREECFPFDICVGDERGSTANEHTAAQRRTRRHTNRRRKGPLVGWRPRRKASRFALDDSPFAPSTAIATATALHQHHILHISPS